MSTNRPFAFGIYKSVERLKQLVNNEYLSDVTFKVGSTGQLIYAHKNIITMASEVFFVQFNGSFAEATAISSPQVVIEDIEPETFLLLMNYIYCDEMELTAKNVFDVYYASQKYLLQELIDRCETFFGTAIDESNALAMLNKNHRHKFPIIDEKCLAIIQDNPLKFFKLELFLNVNQRTVELIAASRKMNCYNEHLQEAIDRWKEANDVKEFDIVPRLEGVMWLKLNSFSKFDYASSIESELSLYVKKPLNLYGLGICISGEEPVTEDTLSLEIVINGVNTVSLSKKVPLRSELYTYEVLFEKVRIVEEGSIEVTVDSSIGETELLYFEEFAPVKQLGSVELTVETEGGNQDKSNCIEYLLYSVE